MNQREIELQMQRGALRERIRAQREALASDLAPLRVTLDTVDYTLTQARASLQWLRKKPAIVTVATAAFITWQPRRVFRMLWRSYGMWRKWQKIQHWLHKLQKIQTKSPL